MDTDRQDIRELLEKCNTLREANLTEIERRRSDVVDLQKQIRQEIQEKDLYGARKVMKEITEREMVNHPDHYQGNKMEVIDIIEDYELGFNLGNTIKYVLRADKKGNKKQDLEKAKWYLERELSKFKG